MTMTIVTSELIWIKSFLAASELFIKRPMQLYCGNQATLHISRNLVFEERPKYIEIDCHFVCERLFLGELATNYLLQSIH